MSLFKKLKSKRLWQKLFYDRLTEPLHLNLLCLPVALFGSYNLKAEFDLIPRCWNAYAILKAARRAQISGVKEVTIVEFGVASGAGLLNMSAIAQKTEKLTGIKIHLVGFDNGCGLPQPRDYRDHPDIYQAYDYPMDFEKLKEKLPNNCRLLIGDVEQTVPEFLQQLPSSAPLGYVVCDLDYYWSTVSSLKIFTGQPEQYLPMVLLYLDDIAKPQHSKYAGELLAVKEFNKQQELRKITRDKFLNNRRLFKNAAWIKQIYQLHLFDHPLRCNTRIDRGQATISNPYL